MRKDWGYVYSESEEIGCPFCGGDNTEFHFADGYGLHTFYCNDCKIEITLDERLPNDDFTELRNLTVKEAFDRWEWRTPEAKEDECPFCGEKIQEWPWGHYLFDSLWCPTCKKRFEFQSHSHTPRSMKRTMREFGKRPKKAVDKTASNIV